MILNIKHVKNMWEVKNIVCNYKSINLNINLTGDIVKNFGIFIIIL